MTARVRSETPHVVVVGAGIVGVSTAIWLQRAGARVTIVDREGPAAGASFGNAGVLAAASIVQIPVPGLWRKLPALLFGRDGPVFVRWGSLPRMLPFLMRYMASARNVERTATSLSAMLHDCADQHLALARETPAERFVEPGDYVFAYENRAAYEKDALGWSLRRRHGHPFEEMDGGAFARYDPVMARGFGFAVRCPEHGRITDPGAYVRALFEHAVSQGARFVRAEVRGVDGARCAALTDDGEIGGDHVVVTAGVHSAALSGGQPVIAERGYHMEFLGPSHVPRSPTMIAAAKFVLSPMEGRLRAAGIVEFGPADARRSPKPFALLKRQTMRALPDLRYAETREWMGYRPATIDSLPFVGRLRQKENVWCGFGHQHVGLSAGPKTGRWIADMIGGRVPNMDMAPFSPARFGKGRILGDTK